LLVLDLMRWIIINIIIIIVLEPCRIYLVILVLILNYIIKITLVELLGVVWIHEVIVLRRNSILLSIIVLHILLLLLIRLVGLILLWLLSLILLFLLDILLCFLWLWWLSQLWFLLINILLLQLVLWLLLLLFIFIILTLILILILLWLFLCNFFNTFILRI
jgi:hypothetical protein